MFMEAKKVEWKNKKYSNAGEDLSEIRNRNESCLLVGDLNLAVGADNLGVEGNHNKISYGEHLVRELEEEGEYVLATNLEGTTGGPWTWFCRGAGKSQSCLDLVIFSADLRPYFQSMIIDKEQVFSPSRVQTKNGKKRLIYYDHFPLIINFLNLPTQRIKVGKVSNCKLNTPGGWEIYEILTNQIQSKIDKLIEDKSLTIEQMKEKIDNLQKKVKFQAFGKSKPATEKAKCQRLE